jgi:hypothetical protein
VILPLVFKSPNSDSVTVVINKLNYTVTKLTDNRVSSRITQYSEQGGDFFTFGFIDLPPRPAQKNKKHIINRRDEKNLQKKKFVAGVWG